MFDKTKDMKFRQVISVCIATTLLLTVVFANSASITLAFAHPRAQTEDAGTALIEGATVTATNGPLRVHATNKRYFADASGRVVYLTGGHTWWTFQDGSPSDPPAVTDFNKYLDTLKSYNHNFIRLWAWEQATFSNEDPVWHHDPMPFERTGPGNAIDSKPKFDLSKLNQAYFDRLRARVIAARDRGFYVGVMLFQGWSLGYKETDYSKVDNPWNGHPFNAANNINGVNGDTDGDGEGHELHTLGNSTALAFQKAYVRKVVDTLNDLDNVLYEISNESETPSRDWQYDIINTIKAHQNGKPRQHPVGMTGRFGENNTDLFNSPADWISPSQDAADYKFNPPAATGNKVIIVDTDHLWGQGGDDWWVWLSFTRGLNPIFMTPEIQPTEDWHTRAWKAMGQTRSLAQRINLSRMTPRSNVASTGSALADPGKEYVVFKADGGPFTVNLSNYANVSFVVEWLNVGSGKSIAGGTKQGGSNSTFIPPFSGHAVLYLRTNTIANLPNSTFLPLVKSF
jgi:hypothetical protein